MTVIIVMFFSFQCRYCHDCYDDGYYCYSACYSCSNYSLPTTGPQIDTKNQEHMEETMDIVGSRDTGDSNGKKMQTAMRPRLYGVQI